MRGPTTEWKVILMPALTKSPEYSSFLFSNLHFYPHHQVSFSSTRVSFGGFKERAALKAEIHHSRSLTRMTGWLWGGGGSEVEAASGGGYTVFLSLRLTAFLTHTKEKRPSEWGRRLWVGVTIIRVPLPPPPPLYTSFLFPHPADEFWI